MRNLTVQAPNPFLFALEEELTRIENDAYNGARFLPILGPLHRHCVTPYNRMLVGLGTAFSFFTILHPAGDCPPQVASRLRNAYSLTKNYTQNCHRVMGATEYPPFWVNFPHMLEYITASSKPVARWEPVGGEAPDLSNLRPVYANLPPSQQA